MPGKSGNWTSARDRPYLASLPTACFSARSHRTRFSVPTMSTGQDAVQLCILVVCDVDHTRLHATDFEQEPLCGCMPPGQTRIRSRVILACSVG